MSFRCKTYRVSTPVFLAELSFVYATTVVLLPPKVPNISSDACICHTTHAKQFLWLYLFVSPAFSPNNAYLGHALSLNSQNRYLYAEADPINNQDPSGHMIGTSSYERQMEALGGINEIYNFYVGTTLQNAYNTASAAFYSRLSYAYGVDYTSQAAINSIVGISQATANAYIQRGTNAALSIGSSWGCSPGALTNQAVATFASDVNTI